MLGRLTAHASNTPREKHACGVPGLACVAIILAAITLGGGCNEKEGCCNRLPPSDEAIVIGETVTILVTGDGLLPSYGLIDVAISNPDKKIEYIERDGKVEITDGIRTNDASIIFKGYLEVDPMDWTTFVVPKSESIQFTVRVGGSGPSRKNTLSVTLSPSERNEQADQFLLTIVGNTDVDPLEMTEEEEAAAGYVTRIDVKIVDRHYQMF